LPGKIPLLAHAFREAERAQGRHAGQGRHLSGKSPQMTE
jgi:hypothetical protein